MMSWNWFSSSVFQAESSSSAGYADQSLPVAQAATDHSSAARNASSLRRLPRLIGPLVV